jgi:hypothetical protein
VCMYVFAGMFTYARNTAGSQRPAHAVYIFTLACSILLHAAYRLGCSPLSQTMYADEYTFVQPPELTQFIE